jgi:hypothetical protein
MNAISIGIPFFRGHDAEAQGDRIMSPLESSALVFDRPSRLSYQQFLLLKGSLKLHLAVACKLKMDSDHLVAYSAGQPPDETGMIAVEAICNAQHSRKPLDNGAMAVIE